MELKEGDFFAIFHGKYTGKFLIFMEKVKGFNYFLMLPGEFKVFYLKDDDFKQALDGVTPVPGKMGLRFIDFVETLPKEVFEVNKAQYEKTCKDKNNYICDIFAVSKHGK